VTSAAQLADLLLVQAAGTSGDTLSTTTSSSSGATQHLAATLAFTAVTSIYTCLPSAAQAAWLLPRLLLLVGCEGGQPLLVSSQPEAEAVPEGKPGTPPGADAAATSSWRYVAAAGAVKPTLDSSRSPAVAALSALQAQLAPGSAGAAWAAAGWAVPGGGGGGGGQAAAGGVKESWDPVQEVLAGFFA
jgi:hypothetical protein